MIKKTPSVSEVLATAPYPKFLLFLKPFFDRHILKRNLFSQILRKLRRSYIGSLHKNYIETSVAETREGQCNRCGLCCQLIYKCPFLGKDVDNLPYCRVYGDLRPANCGNYPFDKVDAEIDGCGYKFK